MKKLRDMQPHEEETMVSFDTQGIYPLLPKRKIQSVEEVGVLGCFIRHNYGLKSWSAQ